MRKRVLLCILILIMVACLPLSACRVEIDSVPLEGDATLDKALADGGYRLVYEDGFNDKDIDYKHWRKGMGVDYRRAAYVVDDAVFVEDGNLIIRTDYREDGVFGEGWYTGWLEAPSKYKYKDNVEGYEGLSYKYGYFEVRCKAPAIEGAWSAFWMMPDTSVDATGMTGKDELGTGRDGVEVDVMESPHYQNKKNKSLNIHVIHGDTYGNDMKSDRSVAYNVGDMYNEYHTYGVMWTEEEYIFYIDGIETYRTPYQYDGNMLGVSNVHEYLLLTVEVGGYRKDGVMHPGKEIDAKGKEVTHWSGDVMKNDKNASYDFVVDYVRIYQR